MRPFSVEGRIVLERGPCRYEVVGQGNVLTIRLLKGDLFQHGALLIHLLFSRSPESRLARQAWGLLAQKVRFW